MNEVGNQNLNPEELKRKKQEQQNIEDAERERDHFKMHPEQLTVPETLREAGPENAEFEGMIAAFEAAHSLEKLKAIVEISPDLATLFEYDDDLSSPKRMADNIERYEKYNPSYLPIYKEKIAAARAILLTPGDEKKYRTRIVAKKDLGLIITKLNALKKETNISQERYEELKAKYRRLSKAVGSLNTLEGKKIDHR